MNVLIFSKDRACQLDLLLRSMEIHFADMDQHNIKILYLASSDAFNSGYDRLMSLWEDRSFTRQIEPFKTHVLKMFDYSDSLTSFLMDDNVFVNSFSASNPEIDRLLAVNGLISISNRLHLNIDYCYPASCKSPIPIINNSVFNWTDCNGDWGYPMSLDFNIYQSDYIIDKIIRTGFDNPNTLEGELHERRDFSKPLMGMLGHSIINIPANRVQTVCDNKCMNINAKFLNEEFLQGRRIVYNMNGYAGNSCHVELPIIMEPYE